MKQNGHFHSFRRMGALLMALVMTALLYVPAAVADTGNISITGVSERDIANGNLRLSVQDVGTLQAAENYWVTIDGQTQSIVQGHGVQPTTGYLFVVDTSAVYTDGYRANAAKAYPALISGLVKTVQSYDSVRFVWVDSAVQDEGQWLTPSDGVAGNKASEFTTRNTANRASGSDVCMLYAGIDYAVSIAYSEYTHGSNFDYYRIFVISDMDNTSMASNSNSAASIAQKIQANRPLPVYAFAFYVPGTTGTIQERVDRGRSEVTDLCAQTKGLFTTINYKSNNADSSEVYTAINQASQRLYNHNISIYVSIMGQGLESAPYQHRLDVASQADSSVADWTGLLNLTNKPAEATAAPEIPAAAQVTAPPAATAPTRIYYLDTNNADVKRLQQVLSDNGFYRKGTDPDGSFLINTYAAYTAMCKLNPPMSIHKEEETGREYVNISEIQMLEVMTLATPTPVPTTAAPATPTPTPEPTATPTPPFVDMSTTGDNVMDLQNLLRDSRYYDGEVDGRFNPATRSAYEEMCDVNGLPVEKNARGETIVSYERWESINGGGIMPKPTPTPTPEPTPTPTPEPTPEPVFAAFGDQDSGNVKLLQQKLNGLNYYYPDGGEFNGNFDTATQNAYTAFCQSNNRTPSYSADNPSTIIITQAEWNSINSDTGLIAAPPTPSPVPAEYIDLNKGDRDNGDGPQYVAQMQQKLVDLGYLGGEDNTYTPGEYDDSTAAAISDWRKENSIDDANEGASITAVELEQNLFSPDTKAKPEAGIVEKVKDFLTSVAFTIGDDFDVPMWALVAAALVIILIIIILIVVIRGRNANGSVPAQEPGDATVATPDMNGGFGGFGGDQSPFGGSQGTGNFTGGNDFFSGQNTGTFNAGGTGFQGGGFSEESTVAAGNTGFQAGNAGFQAGSTGFQAGNAGFQASGTGFQAGNTGFQSGGFGGFNSESTVAGFNGSAAGDDESTISDYMPGAAPANPPVNLEITFRGETRRVTEQINGILTIGRRDCQVKLSADDRTASRHHCDLFFDNGVLRVRNISSSTAGTLVNGQRLAKVQVSGEDAPTVSLAEEEGGETAPVHSGDIITCGQHSIKVTY